MMGNAFYSLAGPLDAVPAEGQMRAANFQRFHDLVHRMGGNPNAVLERHGIDPRAVSDSDFYVDCRALGEVFEYCSSRFDESLFGLQLAELQNPDVFGLVTAICRAAPTFGEAIRSFIKYMPVVHSPVSTLELVEGSEISEFRFSGNFMVQDFEGCQIMYEGGLLIMKLLREIGGKAFQPNYVSLMSIARDRDVADIERVFGCNVRRNAPVNAIAFRTQMLNQPIAGASRQLFFLLDGYLDRVRETARKSIVGRVEDCVRGSFQTGNCSIEWCAQKLGLTPRTLRSRLNQFGMKFSDIVERQRADLATYYLQRMDLSLDDVAFSLGYAEQSSFGRAFKRWTGVTPQGFREQFDEASR